MDFFYQKKDDEEIGSLAHQKSGIKWERETDYIAYVYPFARLFITIKIL